MSFESKPVSLVIIGLIGGFILGVGGGYLTIYPSMVKTQTDELNLRVTVLESSFEAITDMTNRLDNLESSAANIPSLESKISLIEDSTNDLSLSVDSIEDELFEVKTLFSNLQELVEFGDLSNFSDQLDSIEATLSSIDSELDVMGIRLDESESYGLLKRTLAKPGKDITNEITDELFDQLESSEYKFVQWISVVGETHAKDTLRDIMNLKIPSLVWNDYDIDLTSSNTYSTYAVTYFPITFDTEIPILGEITVTRVQLIMKGTVDIATEMVSSLEIVTLII